MLYNALQWFTLQYIQAILKKLVELAVASEIRKILMNDLSDLYFLSETHLQDPSSSSSQLQTAYANLQKKWTQYNEVLERFWMYFSAQWGFSGRFQLLDLDYYRVCLLGDLLHKSMSAKWLTKDLLA
jgi:hypothetical protein